MGDPLNEVSKGRRVVSSKRSGKTDALWRAAQRWMRENPGGVALWVFPGGEAAAVDREAEPGRLPTD